MIGVYRVQLWHTYLNLGWIHLIDYLEDGGQCASKFNGLWHDLSICCIIGTGHPLVGIHRQVKDEVQTEVLQGGPLKWRTSLDYPWTHGQHPPMGGGRWIHPTLTDPYPCRLFLLFQACMLKHGSLERWPFPDPAGTRLVLHGTGLTLSQNNLGELRMGVTLAWTALLGYHISGRWWMISGTKITPVHPLLSLPWLLVCWKATLKGRLGCLFHNVGTGHILMDYWPKEYVLGGYMDRDRSGHGQDRGLGWFQLVRTYGGVGVSGDSGQEVMDIRRDCWYWTDLVLRWEGWDWTDLVLRRKWQTYLFVHSMIH